MTTLSNVSQNEEVSDSNLGFLAADDPSLPSPLAMESGNWASEELSSLMSVEADLELSLVSLPPPCVEPSILLSEKPRAEESSAGVGPKLEDDEFELLPFAFTDEEEEELLVPATEEEPPLEICWFSLLFEEEEDDPDDFPCDDDDFNPDDDLDENDWLDGVTGTHLYIFIEVSPIVTHFFSHLRTLSIACIALLRSSFARLLVSALRDLDAILIF